MLAERRKVQQVGKATISVSLPKAWVNRRGIKKGDYVLVSEQLDGSLRLDLDSPPRAAPAMVLEASRFPSAYALTQALLSWYMLGYDEVTVSGALTDELLSAIHSLAKRLRGVEAVHVTPAKVVLQSFLEESRYPVDALLSRLLLLISSMIQYLLNAVKEAKPEYLNEVSRLRGDAEELYWLIVRQLLLALRRPELAAKLRIDSPLHATGNRLIARSLLRAALLLDACAELIFQPIAARRWGAGQIEGLAQLLALAGELLRLATSFLDRADLPSFLAYYSKLEQMAQLAERLTQELGGLDLKGARSYLLAVERLSALARLAEDVAEVAIHRLIRRMDGSSA